MKGARNNFNAHQREPYDNKGGATIEVNEARIFKGSRLVIRCEKYLDEVQPLNIRRHEEMLPKRKLF